MSGAKIIDAFAGNNKDLINQEFAPSCGESEWATVGVNAVSTVEVEEP